jgi:hypothetical protein
MEKPMKRSWLRSRERFQMIDNYTHKEWECAQTLLKHQGRVNRVFDEMNVSFSPCPRPSTAGKKMQPSGNIGSEPAETSKKGKTSKAAVATEGATKSTKASDVLAQRKVEAAKTTLPLVAKKMTELMKVSENLLRRKTDAAKVVAAEKEKKKSQDIAPLVILEKKTILERKNPNVNEKDKEIVNEGPQLEVAKPQAKKPRAEKVSEDDEDIDVISTPQIQPSTFYPPKDSRN